MSLPECCKKRSQLLGTPRATNIRRSELHAIQIHVTKMIRTIAPLIQTTRRHFEASDSVHHNATTKGREQGQKKDVAGVDKKARHEAEQHGESISTEREIEREQP